MAHPYAEHRQNKVEKSRVGSLTKGYASAGSVHSDAPADRQLVRGMVKPDALKSTGPRPKTRLDRFARGGKVGKKGATTVNVVVAPQAPAAEPATPPLPMPPPAAAAPPPPMPPRPPMPMGGPPGMPPGMPPGIRKNGGRAFAKGGAVKSGPAWEEGRRNGTQVTHSAGKNDTAKISRTPPITKKRGGSVKGYPLSAGSDSGEGRLQKTKSQRKSYP